MTKKPWSRWQAAGVHFLICVAIAATVVTLMLRVWYPGPLFEASGGDVMLRILVSVDVSIGPLLTLIVFKSGKPGMKFDLAVIGTLQAMALAYGVHVVSLARPAFVVFVVDRFEVVAAADLEPEELAQARYAEFRVPPANGPKWAAADLPEDPAERQKLVEAALAGRDLQHFPRLFVPYAERARAVLAKAKPLAKLREDTDVTAAIDAYLAGEGAGAKDRPALLLRTRFAWLVVIVDPQTAEPAKMLLGQKILQ